VDNPDVVVECVKLADDQSGDVVVRLYEARGGRADTRLAIGFPLERAEETNLLEKPTGPIPAQGNAVELTLRPFQIRTLRLTLGTADG
jgi:alpha-mannosidase